MTSKDNLLFYIDGSNPADDLCETTWPMTMLSRAFQNWARKGAALELSVSPYNFSRDIIISPTSQR